jgi:hypothetical protein
MSLIDILKQFKNALISFLDELIVQFPHDPDLVIFRIFLKDRTEIVQLMNFCVHKILPFKDMVKNRNEDFFLNHFTLLELNNSVKNKANRFKKLWRSPSLDSDDKRIVWEWFDSFIYLAEKYQHVLIKQTPA